MYTSVMPYVRYSAIEIAAKGLRPCGQRDAVSTRLAGLVAERPWRRFQSPNTCMSCSQMLVENVIHRRMFEAIKRQTASAPGPRPAGRRCLPG